MGSSVCHGSMWFHVTACPIAPPPPIPTCRTLLLPFCWLLLLLVQYGEAPENKEFGEEFCKAMTYFTRHSLEGGNTTLQVGGRHNGA